MEIVKKKGICVVSRCNEKQDRAVLALGERPVLRESKKNDDDSAMREL